MTGISEHSRRFSEDFRTSLKMSKDVPKTFSMTTFEFVVIKLSAFFGLFSGILNLIFLIIHVLKNNSSGFVSQA